MDSREYEELRKKFPFEFCKLSVKFDPPLTDEEKKFIDDILVIGQRIKDRESLKKILLHVFWSTWSKTLNLNKDIPSYNDV